jgi:hypothetical protein
MIEILQTQAFTEEFKLICTQSVSPFWNRLCCYHLKKKGQKMDPYGFLFKIQTGPTRTDFYCYVTTFSLHHNCAVDRVLFADHVVTETTVYTVLPPLRIGYFVSNAAWFPLEQHNISRNTCQVWEPIHINKLSTHQAEILEPERFVAFVSEAIHLLEAVSDGQAGADSRIPVVIFTPAEASTECSV